MSAAHVIGAGLAGLSAAVRLAQAGHAVHLYEAAPRAGGRCRSYFEPRLDCTIDNGGHVILGANAATLAYIETIGARDEVTEIAPAQFPFLDLATGARWSLRPNAGPVPWWPLASARRVAGTGVLDYAALLRLILAGAEDTVTDCVVTRSALYRRLIDPLATAVMNTPPEQAAAQPLARVLRATLMRGERACRPIFARRGLSFALVDPASAWLERHGVRFRTNTRVDRLDFAAGRVSAIAIDGVGIEIGPTDRVVLATPPWIAAELVPGLSHPTEHCAIVNAHFRLPRPVTGTPLLGLIGGLAQWLIVRGDVVSVTVSAADGLLDEDQETLLDRLWHDTAKGLGLSGARPPGRLIKEKRATFRQTPAAERQRPAAQTGWPNLFLAGDWTATGLPATIEGAILSGQRAALAAVSARVVP